MRLRVIYVRPLSGLEELATVNVNMEYDSKRLWLLFSSSFQFFCGLSTRFREMIGSLATIRLHAFHLTVSNVTKISWTGFNICFTCADQY